MGITIPLADWEIWQETWRGAAEGFQALGWVFQETWLGAAFVLCGAVLLGTWVWRVIARAAK